MYKITCSSKPDLQTGQRSSRTRSESQFRNNLKGALLPSRGMAALPREQVFGKGPGACEGGGVRVRLEVV